MPPARHLRAWVVAGVCLLFAASSEAALVVKAWKPPGAARFILACVADAVIDLPTCATVNDGFDCRVLATDALYLCNGGSWAAVGGGGGGVTGLTSCADGTAIADNALLRGDGTTKCQGSPLRLLDSGALEFEGTADSFEGNFTFEDPTADWTWNWTGIGVAQGKYIELASGTGANYYGDSSVSLTVNRGGSGFAIGIYNSDDGVFGIENQGTSSGKVTMGATVPIGWDSSATFAAQDTSLSREAADVVKIDSLIELTPVASGGTCDAGNEGRIYSDSSHALCWCDGTTAQKLSGAGTCD